MHGVLGAVLGWALGGFLNGIAGFGGALVALPIVALSNDMRLTAGSTALVVLGLSMQQAYCYRQKASLAGAGPVLLGALPGVAAGALLLHWGSEAALRTGLGALLLAYGISGPWISRRRSWTPAPSWGALAGFFSTCLGTAYGINGPPLAIFLSLKGGGQAETKGTLGVFFIISGTLIVITQALTGMDSRQTLLLFAASLPSTLAGAWLGIRVSTRLNDKAFQVCLYAVLMLLGANLIRTGLTL